MIPQKSQYVKIIFNNMMSIEGIVENWSDNKSVIKTSDNNFQIINNTLENVLTYKIFIDKISKEDLPKYTEKLQQEFNDTYDQPSADDLRIKKLADLKSELIKQERAIIVNKLKEHMPTQIPTIKDKYESPFIKKCRTK